MRTRRFPSAIGGLLVLMAIGCGSNEAGPTPARVPRDPGPDALPTKVHALSADQCFRTPKQQVAQGCAKYVAELANVASSVRKRAGSQEPQLAALADTVDTFVGHYRANACGTATIRDGGPCTQALVEIAVTLEAIKTALT